MTWPSYSPACRRDVDQLLRSGKSLTAYRASDAFPDWIGPKEGSHAYKLEREIEAKFKVKHAVAVNSGTAALHAAILLGKGLQGREVITSPYTFSATASAILLSGGIPVFADIDPWTYSINLETVKRAITKKTAAILSVDLFGWANDVDALKSFGAPVLEDSCQSVGAFRNGSYSGTRGVSGAYSFNGSKNIPSGEGGCLITNSDKIAKKARLFINHAENFGSKEVGFNYRMQEVVALIARHGLKDLDERNQRRRDLVRVVDRVAWGYQGSVPISRDHVHYVEPFQVNASFRPLFIKRMAKRGIPVQAGYTTPLHHLPAFRKYAKHPLPVVDEVHKKLCLLTTLTPDRPLSYAKKVAKAIRESLE